MAQQPQSILDKVGHAAATAGKAVAVGKTILDVGRGAYQLGRAAAPLLGALL